MCLQQNLGATVIGSFFRRPAPDESAAGKTVSEFDEDYFIKDRFGLSIDSITQKPISKGLSSLSLTRYSGPDGPFMVRKRVAKSKDTEAAFMRALRDHSTDLKRVFRVHWCLPEVYEVIEQQDHFDIYMQVVEGIVRKSRSDSSDLVPPLANAIHEMSLILQYLGEAAKIAPVHRGKPGYGFFAQAATKLGDSIENLHEILKLQNELPSFLSHNDIFWSNLGVSAQDRRQSVTFIDFGMLGLNAPGAELHHFARISVRSRAEAELFFRITRHYSTHSRLSPALIKTNAYLYASMRLIAHENDSKVFRDALSRTACELLENSIKSFRAIE